VVDVVLSNNDLTVLGGPSSLTVNVDIGAQGTRGSFIFTGDGKPDDPTTELGFVPAINDLYINLKPADTEYLFLYQYTSVNGVASWQRTIRIVPNTALYNPLITFVNGQAVYELAGVQIPTILFPLATFFSIDVLGDIEALDFSIQHNVLCENPVASGLTVSELTATYDISGVSIPLGSVHLPLNLTASELHPTNGWQPLNGQYYVHSFITIGGRAT
jgi:hypothetical protein